MERQAKTGKNAVFYDTIYMHADDRMQALVAWQSY